MTSGSILPEEQARALLALDEGALRQQLGLQLSAMYTDPSRSLQPAPHAQALAAMAPITLPPWVPAAVDAMVNRAAEELEKVLCGTDPTYVDLRNKLISATGLGEVALVGAVTVFLAGPLGITLAVAGILATIIVKTVGEPAINAGIEEICKALAQRGTPAPAGAAAG
jgi:hypothetical protein